MSGLHTRVEAQAAWKYTLKNVVSELCRCSQGCARKHLFYFKGERTPHGTECICIVAAVCLQLVVARLMELIERMEQSRIGYAQCALRTFTIVGVAVCSSKKIGTHRFYI